MRHLCFDGCDNARDFGGLKTKHGATTVWKQFVRSDSSDLLTVNGWRQLEEHGVKTIIDLRDPTERLKNKAPSTVTKIDLPLEDNTDVVFWRQWRRYSSTPLYYEPFMARNSKRIEKVFSTIADIDDGAILIHCVAGRDRTGLISLLLQAIADVEEEEIISDYEQSATRLQAPMFKQERPYLDRLYEEENTTSRQALTKMLANFNARDYLQASGLSETRLQRIRRRLTPEHSQASKTS